MSSHDLLGLQPTKTRRPNLHVGQGDVVHQLRSEDPRLRQPAQLDETLVVPVEGPDVVGVPLRAREGVVVVVEPQVGGVDLGGHFDVTLFEKQGAVGVARGLHPTPRFVVGEGVVQPDGLPEPRVGLVEMTLAVRYLPFEHGGRDGQDVGGGVVEQGAGGFDPGQGRPEQVPLGDGLGGARRRGVRDALAVVGEGGRHAVEVLVGGEREGEEVVPHPEPDQDVHAHADERLEPVGHRRGGDPQQGPGEVVLDDPRRGEGGAFLRREQGRVQAEVGVVGHVERVKVQGAGAREVLPVRGHGGAVPRDGRAVVAAQDVEVRGHVAEVTRVRDQVAEGVGVGHGAFGRGRHLHQVDVQMEEARVGGTPRQGEGVVEDPFDLQGLRVGGRTTGAKVPECPGREVHEGVGAERGDFEVVGELGVDGAHGVRVREVPDRAVRGRLVLRVPKLEGVDQCLFDGGGTPRLRDGRFNGRVGP